MSATITAVESAITGLSLVDLLSVCKMKSKVYSHVYYFYIMCINILLLQ